jgi:hypothetical protein
MEYIHNFKIDPLTIVSNNWKRPFDKEQYFTKYIPEWQSIFTQDFLDVFKDHIKVAMVFNKPTNWNETSKGNSVHVDEGDIICAMNIVLPTTDNLSLMEWFHTDIDHKELLIGSNSNYAARWNGENAWTQKRFQLLHQSHVDNTSTLVRVDVPHRVVVSRGARVCISVRFKEKFTVWSDAVTYVESLFQELHHK